MASWEHGAKRLLGGEGGVMGGAEEMEGGVEGECRLDVGWEDLVSGNEELLVGD